MLAQQNNNNDHSNSQKQEYIHKHHPLHRNKQFLQNITQ
jgi:hypothetical protein